MSLFRIPFLAATLAGTHITYTSPAAPPKGYERIEERTNIKPSRFVPFSKGVFWAFAIAEFTTIFAPLTPWPGLSYVALSVLVFKDHPVQLFLTPLSVFGAILSAFGGFIRWDCYRRMGKQFTFDLSIREEHRLVTEGAYGYIRHPGYASALLTIIGTIFFHGSRGSWLRESGFLDIKAARFIVGIITAILLSPMFILFNRMRVEDQALRERFGTDWDRWAQKVPSWLVPGVY
ncbi:hypothetical protein DXG01_007335 [Tephrocybe rancida]|nr:hypothetical protein DXG01_007335 [Tephrocybe rancida]